MVNIRLFSTACIALAVISLLGCQGGSSLPVTHDSHLAAAGAGLVTATHGPMALAPVHPPQSWLAHSGGIDDVSLPQGLNLPAQPRQASGAVAQMLDPTLLPPLPVPEPRKVEPGARNVSATHNVGLSDLAYLVDYGGGAMPVGGSLDLGSAAGGLAYAIYKVELTPGEALNGFSITGVTTARGADYSRHGVWVGVSDFTDNIWYFADQLVNPPSTYENPTDIAGTVAYTWPPTGSVFVNAANRTTYLMVGAQDGDAVTISAITVYTTGGGTSILPPEWTTALTNAGITKDNLGMQPIFDPTDANLLTPDNFAWQDPYTDIRTILPMYWKQWYYGKETVKMPDTINTKRDEFRVTDSIQDLLLSAIAEFPVDQQSTVQDANDALAGTDPLANAIKDYVEAVGGTSNLAAYQAALAEMNDLQQRALARVVKACQKAWQDRHDVLYGGGFDDTSLQTYFEGTHPYWLPSPNKPAGYAPVYMVDDDGAGPHFYYMRAFPYVAAFFPEACYVADAIDQLTEFIKTNSPVWPDVNLDVDTPAGKIVISGTADDTHAAALPNGHLILIDLGGKDTYNCNAGGTASALNGVAVAIDMAGDDIYNAMDDPLNQRTPPDDETCQQGSARYGVGMLIDYSGKDDYSCVRMGQGAAVMGVGVLADFAGDDNYEGEALVQGAAYGGVGLLYDKTGGDDYSAWSLGQGFGGIMGVGFLVDQNTGDDFYFAVPDFDASRPEYASAQDAAYNANFCQGAALGKRWDTRDPGDPNFDPIVGAGGLGLMYDGGGVDTFNCGIFGQAVGFFQSLGVLVDDDSTGDLDTYHGIWYVQGATAHVACAFLWENGGGDSYWSRSSIAIGGAHDWSVTWFMDRGGDDTYNGSSLSTGTGYNSGQGFCIDMGGNDNYYTDNCDGTSETLGRGGWPVTGRETDTSIGIFVDAGGADFYSAEYVGMLDGSDGGNPSLLVATPPVDGASWVRINGDSSNAGLAGMGFYPLGIGSGIDSGT